MKYSLKYGNSFLEIHPPGGNRLIETKPTGNIPDKKSFSRELSALLKEGAGTAGIVISDKTRVCEYRKFLPWLIEVLKKKGLSRSSIRFYIAYGTHPKQTEEESLRVYGRTYKDYEFVHHDCDDAGSMKELGRTSRGTVVRIRKDILDHDIIILFGVVSHHYFAGYGGGRKLLFPGLAGREGIYHNHRLFIDFDNMKLREGCRSGNLENNPVAEDLYEIDRLMPGKIIINGIPGDGGKISKLMMGTGYDDFILACKTYDKLYRIDGELKYDNVIASAGGYPKDINFIQSHKSLHNAASLVKDGGNLFLLGECRDGLGNNEFLDIFRGSRKEIFNRLYEEYSGNGGTALSLLSKTDRINVYMVTDLEKNICDTLQIKKIGRDDLIARSENLTGSTAIIENASMVYC